LILVLIGVCAYPLSVQIFEAQRNADGLITFRFRIEAVYCEGRALGVWYAIIAERDWACSAKSTLRSWFAKWRSLRMEGS
jgi:hypothetical protein